MSSPIEPMLLEELGIPGRSKDPVSTNPDVWGINIAAALDNFPLHGLLCQAGPWGNMAEGDRLTVFWGTGQNVWVETVNKDEVKTQLRMFVPPRHMVDGEFAVSYSVRLLGASKDEPSEVMQVLVKLTRPGGDDDNGDDGHSKLIMIIPQEIVDGGIHEENVKDGVPISIGKADGTPPYPYAAAGDICRVSWGGIFVLSEPLTQEQAEGNAPIIITITKEIIVEAGDAPGVAVVFEVYDCVFNRSRDWSPEQRIEVAVDATRLGAPLLKETVNNVLDVDQLGDANGTVQVIATDTSKFKIGDIPFIQIKGTPVEGAPIDLDVEGTALTSVPSVIEIKAPNAVLRQLAKSQITLSYRLKKADGSADLKSKSQFIRAIGEVQRLAAPIVLDEKSGALDPTLPQIRLEIPFDKSLVEGQVLQPVMLGTTPGLKPYLPELPTRPITHNDIVAAEPLLYNIEGTHLAPVNGGTAEFYYQLLIPSAVLNTLDAFEATRAIRESIHSDILRVGEARQELPQPEVAGVLDGVLPADTAGTTATVIYKETVSGDEIFMFWLGSITGEYPDSIKLNEFTAGKEVPFTIPAAMIKGNEGGTVEVKYEIERAAGGTSYSDTLKFSVGVALDLKAPKIKEVPNDTSLDPLDAQNTLTAVIDYDGMLVGDNITARWKGARGTLPGGSHTTDPWPVTRVGPQEIPLAVSVIAFNLDKSITLDYSVTRGTQEPKDSQTRTLAVLQLRVDLSHSPKIIQAADGGDGTELDVSTLTAAATLRGGFWPHIADGQRVWMEVQGTKKDDTEYKRVVWTGPSNAVNALWISQGYLDASLPLADLQSLKHQSELTVTFNATPDCSTDVNDALSFPIRTYTVSAIATPTFTNAPYTIAPAGRLKNIELLLSTSSDTPVPGGKLSLTLPAPFTYADGSSGQREFITDDVGRVSVSGVKGALNPGPYNLSVTSGSKTDNTTITVTVPGPITSIPVGGMPYRIAFSPDGTRVYTSNFSSDTISVIDTATNLVLTNFPVEKYPAGIAVSPDGTRAYICSQAKKMIQVIDVATNQVLKNFPVEQQTPEAVAFSPDGKRAYVCNYSNNSVSVIDTAMDRVLTNISTGQAPYAIAISPNGTRAYVCRYHTVSVIDLTTNQVLTDIPTGNPIGIAVSPDGNRAYVCDIDSLVSVIDMATNLVLKNIPIGDIPTGIAVSPDGNRAYACGNSGTVSVIDTATDRVLTSIPVGQRLQSIVLSPDGTRAYICETNTQKVLVIDTATD